MLHLQQKIRWIMENIKLFKNLKDYEIDELLGFLQATTKVYKKNEIIINKGSKIKDILVVLVGTIEVYIKNFDEKEVLLSEYDAGEAFGLNLVCGGVKTSSYIVRAKKQTGVLFLPFEKMLELHSSVSNWQKLLLKNLFELIAKENIAFSNRLDILNQKTIREKILFYLNSVSLEKNSLIFEIPYSREEMAQYLCVDRSALSRELSNMQKDGLLEYKKNEFSLISF